MEPVDILVVGSGLIGSVTGACLADQGHRVTCQDSNAARIHELSCGNISFWEPELKGLIRRNVLEKRLTFATDIALPLRKASLCIVAVDTPCQADGSADLSNVFDVAKAIAAVPEASAIIAIKSTVPVGTCQKIERYLRERRAMEKQLVVASNPEFLSEGSSVRDFLQPDRVIVGSNSQDACKLLETIYRPFISESQPFIIMDVCSAELAKYGANAMLAARISMVNELASICDEFGADVDSVCHGIGTDVRIGHAFLGSGFGFGGPCLPKDVSALQRIGEDRKLPMRMARAISAVNEEQSQRFVDRICRVIARILLVIRQIIVFWVSE